MSCDWDIICVDCNEEHGFSDLNHEDHAMQVIVRHADAIAALCGLEQDLERPIEFLQYRGRTIQPVFFKKHQGHQLRPIDEYGRMLGDCTEWADCSACGGSHPCRLPENHAAEQPHRSDPVCPRSVR